MRVAFDIAQTAVERAGCAWYADGLARALARVSTVQLDLYPHFDAWINTGPEAATRVAGARLVFEETTPEEARLAWSSAAEQGLPDRPEIVHANSFQAPVVAGARLVFTVHDLGFWSHPEFASEGTRQHCQQGVLDALERAAGLVFVSHAARAEFEAILPGWMERTRRPSAVICGASRFSPLSAATDPSTDAPWLCVGSIEPRKNHATLLDAYSLYRRMVPRPRALHVIGGRGWHSDAIHQRLASMSPVDGVCHRGYVSDPELADSYRGAFGLIQPSWHEGFGLPVVEAGSFGVPAICSDIPSLREIGGDAAIFFPPGDPAELAGHMAALHRTAATARGSLAMASIANAERYSWDDSASRAVAFYQSILA